MDDSLKRARAPLPETRAYLDASGNYVRERPGARTTITIDDDMVKCATAEYVSEEFLKRMAHMRNQEKRAPLGDSHGGWQKVGEYPMTWFFDQLPKGAWEDKRALAKVINNPDNRAFRADGAHRRF